METKATPQLAQFLRQKGSEIQSQVNRLTAELLKKEVDLARREADSKEQARSLAGVRDLPFWLAPGNVGDINQIIWPFWYSTPLTRVVTSAQVPTGFTVSQSAAFIMVSYSKVVFTEDTVALPPLNTLYEYLDPNDSAGAGMAPGLRFSLRDAQSTRVFADRTIAIDHVGNPRFPTYLAAPQLLLPNSNFEVLFESDGPETYWTALTFHGIRVRIEDAYNILSTVYSD